MTRLANNEHLPLEERILAAINELGNQYRICQGLILTEDDIKCLIYKIIYDLIEDHGVPTFDTEIKASPLHSEIPFYDEAGKLRLKPDITIIDPGGMSIKHGLSIRVKNNQRAYGKLPEKGFEFGGKVITIEIKFCKTRKGITQKFEDKIRDDLSKIERLMQRNNRPIEDNTIFGIVVIFNKTNNGVNRINNLIQEYSTVENIKIVYCSGNVVF